MGTGAPHTSIMPKDIRYLSQRRKNQLIARLANNRHLDLLECTIQNTAPNVAEEAVFISENCDTVSCASHSCFKTTNDFQELLVPLQSNTKSNEEHIITFEETISTLSDTFINRTSLWQDLQTFIIERNIPHNAANELLQIFKKHGHIELPNDVRVLLSTPRNVSIYMRPVGNGRYIHFGLSSSLKRSIQMYSTFIKESEIKLNINIDGLPISKSSGSQFWPIMASIEGVDIYTLPFIIGIYYGMCKPKDVNDFMIDFVNEFISLSQNGITVSNKKYNVVINAILCDAPARSLITYTKGHTGYFSCPKCIQEGAFLHKRVIFKETHNALRTNESFKNRNQEEHHTGRSILEKLDIGMVSQILIDYMHLVCLGVVKRMLQFFLRGNKSIRLSAEVINTISRYLIAIRAYIPSEFARKPREFQDVDKWKATEFRQILLYTGIVVMKPILSQIYYDHFVTLSVAIRILSDPQLCQTLNAYANSLLLWFVSNYGNLYGDEYLSYNVHNLLHLANDVQTFGPLDNFSCFKYENHMQKLKKKLHQSGKPLEEIYNRISEEAQIPIRPYSIVQYPIAIFTNKNEISHVQFKSFKISKKKNDNTALLYNNDVVFVSNIFYNNDVLFVRAQRFVNKKSFFNIPCASEKFGIFVISHANSDIIEIPVKQIKSKCLKIKSFNDDNSHVVIPLLESNN